MKTTVNNQERVFWLRADYGTPGVRHIFCNLADIPSMLSNFDVDKGVTIKHLFNGEFKRVSKKYLIDMFEANGVNFKKTYVFSFKGREAGAIGKMYKIRGVKVVADCVEDAKIKLYNSYEHIEGLRYKIKY